MIMEQQVARAELQPVSANTSSWLVHPKQCAPVDVYARFCIQNMSWSAKRSKRAGRASYRSHVCGLDSSLPYSH